MELESVQEIIRFFSNQELLSPVPEEEYLLQKTKFQNIENLSFSIIYILIILNNIYNIIPNI